MDPQTMMMIANVASQMMSKQGQQGGQGGAPSGPPQMQKPSAGAPGPIPFNPGDYGSMINNMIPKQMPKNPMMGNPAMAGLM